MGPPTIILNQVSDSSVHLSWVYAFSNGEDVALFGRHDYFLSPGDCGSDGNSTWLLSWEKAGGDIVENNRRVEEHTLQKATLCATEGMDCLEQVFEKTGDLQLADVKSICGSRNPRQVWEEMIDGGYYI